MLYVVNPHPDLKQTDHVVWQKLNGDCIYVTDEGCSIHDKPEFPQECRDFDCRENIHPSVRPQELRAAMNRMTEQQKRQKFINTT